MKITLSQLRQIIKEEAKRAINETGDKSSGSFDKMLGGLSRRASELANKDISMYTAEEVQYFTSGLENVAEAWQTLLDRRNNRNIR